MHVTSTQIHKLWAKVKLLRKFYEKEKINTLFASLGRSVRRKNCAFNLGLGPYSRPHAGSVFHITGREMYISIGTNWLLLKLPIWINFYFSDCLFQIPNFSLGTLIFTCSQVYYQAYLIKNECGSLGITSQMEMIVSQLILPVA